MVIVRFRTQEKWFKANWLFGRFAGYLETATDDPALKQELVESVAFGMLDLDGMDEARAVAILRVIEDVATKTVNGSLDGLDAKFALDASGYQMYRNAIGELL